MTAKKKEPVVLDQFYERMLKTLLEPAGVVSGVTNGERWNLKTPAMVAILEEIYAATQERDGLVVPIEKAAERARRTRAEHERLLGQLREANERARVSREALAVLRQQVVRWQEPPQPADER